MINNMIKIKNKKTYNLTKKIIKILKKQKKV